MFYNVPEIIRNANINSNFNQLCPMNRKDSCTHTRKSTMWYWSVQRQEDEMMMFGGSGQSKDQAKCHREADISDLSGIVPAPYSNASSGRIKVMAVSRMKAIHGFSCLRMMKDRKWASILGQILLWEMRKDIVIVRLGQHHPPLGTVTWHLVHDP